MAKFNYARAKSTANRLITKFGQQGALLRYVAPANRQTKATYTAIPLMMAVTAYRDNQVDGTRILATDQQIFASATNITEVTPDDRIRLENGTELEIITVLPVNPGGTVVVFEIQARA